MSSETDRNLLFGVLALQADLLDPQQFAEACSAWAAHKETSLAALLVERGFMTTEQEKLVTQLMELSLRKHAGDATVSLAVLFTANSKRALAQVADPVVQQSVAFLSATDGAMGTATVDYEPRGRERYTMTRLYAKGGIGQVWIARDADLGREVALKELRPERAGSAPALARFVEEAKITGQLQHPSIVPVYEFVPSTGDAPAFYTMRFIKGRTLDDAVHVYHRERAAGTTDSLMLRALLGNFVAVCNSVAYAHSRRVLHRDLKPQNIVLGDFGEVIVLDWGLAKLTGAKEPTASVVSVSVGPAGSRDETAQGSVLGTPAYMAPEQAEGQLDLIDERTDVYGLGAVLYHILVGQAPFDGDDALHVLRQVVNEPPIPPRRRVSTSPPPLDAVCLKALAKKPYDRYAMAKELAQEVQRWLADEPVAAFPDPWTIRSRRWVGRHRTAVTAMAAATAVAVACLAVATGLLTSANQRERAARAEATTQRDEALKQRGRAESYYDKVLAVVDRLLTRVGQDRLAKVPGFEAERRRILEDALEFYQGFLKEKDDPDPRVRRESGRAYNRAGILRQFLGRLDDAENAYREAISVQRAVIVEFGNGAADRNYLAESLSNLGRLNLQRHRLDAAQESFDEALRLWEELTQNQPDDPSHRKRIAQTSHNLSILHRHAGRTEQAEGYSNKALETQDALVRDFPAVEEYQYVLAGVWQSRGNNDYAAGRHEQAAKAYTKAVAILEPVVKVHPELVEYRSFLAGTLDNLAVVQKRMNRFDLAEVDMEKGRRLFEDLVRESPNVPGYRYDLAMCWDNLGGLRFDLDRTDEAEKAFRNALELLEQLTTDQPNEPRYREHLRRVYDSLGNLYRDTDRLKDAEGFYQKSLILAQALVKGSPKIPDFQVGLARAHLLLGGVYARTARRDQAEAELARAQAVAEPLAAGNPESDEYQALMAWVHSNRGLVYLASGQLQSAGIEIRRAVSLLETMVRSHPENAEHAVDLGIALAELGSERVRAGKALEALETYARAIALLEGLIRDNPRYAVARKALAEAHTGRAHALERMQRHAEALQELNKAIALATGKGRDACRADRASALMHLGRRADAYKEAADLEASRSLTGSAVCRLAGVHALAAAADNDSGMGEAHVAKAMELLTRARDTGYFADPANVAAVKENDDLATIRSRPEFARLLTEKKP